MTELQSLKAMFKRVGIPIIHKHHPRWATADRIIYRGTDGFVISFNFGHQGELINFSWSPHCDQDLGEDEIIP